MMLGKFLTGLLVLWILWAMLYSTVTKAYEIIETPCPQVFCVDSTPYWYKQSWRYWIEQTEQYRPNRYYVQRSVWSVRQL